MHIVGIEGGATKTSAVLLDDTGRVLGRARAGLSNAKFLSESQLAALFRSLRQQLPGVPGLVSICLAGAITAADHRKIRAAAARVWPRARCVTATDRESALMAAFGRLEGIVVICGTGSAVFGMRDGQVARCGGWGHLLGDRASGYDVALQALRSAIAEYDHSGRLELLGRRLLTALNCNRPEELVDWVQQASKADIAALAPAVFAAAAEGDRQARRIVQEAGAELARSVEVVARRLRWKRPTVALLGGVFANQPAFGRHVQREIRRRLPSARLQRPAHDGAVGAALWGLQGGRPGLEPLPPTVAARPVALAEVATALTEQRNPRSRNLHRQSVLQLFDLMLREESRTIPAIRACKPGLVACIETVVRALRRGGRLFYVGAGTSGRLGLLDASECPPTFSVDPTTVQAILAGGQRAMYASVEEAEDDGGAGAEAVRQRGLGQRDVVVGIAASGRTPFVLGALREAIRRGARAYLLTANPSAASALRGSRIRPLVVATGPEVITGSTRLKAGTATKLVLNLISTISMIRLGKVFDNLMVDVKPTNEKLRDRACRIVMALRGCSYAEAWRRLEAARWNVPQVAKGR